MTREDLLAGLFPFVPGDIIKPVMQAVDAYTAAKDKEIGELKAENRRLREGLEEVLRFTHTFDHLNDIHWNSLQDRCGEILNHPAGKDPSIVDKNNS